MMSHYKSNEFVKSSLVDKIKRKLSRDFLFKSQTLVSDISINYFSFVFSIDMDVSGDSKRFFVKIPKENLQIREKTILPITAGDRKMAEAEIDSLKELENSWKSDDLKVYWIRLKTIDYDYNAIVTEAVYGAELLDSFRKWDLFRRIGKNKNEGYLISTMSRLGMALGRFHNIHAKKGEFIIDNERGKVNKYCLELKSCMSESLERRIRKATDRIFDHKNLVTFVFCLKGIDLRNVLINDEKDLFFLDPGGLKDSCFEADLARFIMTYRILYWGSKLFFLRLTPSKNAENAFYKAYYETTNQSPSVLQQFYLIKEQLKHWHTAVISLKLLKIPNILKWAVEKTFINPYYVSQIKIELNKIKETNV